MKTTLNLAGTWNLVSSDTTKKINVPANIPGETHSALFAAGVIEDPYWAKNELDVLWVGRTDWTFSRDFEIDKDFLNRKSVYLICERLDTVCEIFINGRSVGNSENMFLRFKADIKQFLAVGTNNIEICFKAPVNEANRRADEYGTKLLAPYGDVPVPGYEPNSNFLRKTLCHSGWDWGIALVVTGIYDKIFLQSTDDVLIEYVYTDQCFENGACTLITYTEVLATTDCDTEHTVSVGDVACTQKVSLKEGMNTLISSLKIDNPNLWWPSGYGEQYLYEMKVQTGSDELNRKIGLRKLQLKYAEDEIGREFTFSVNDIDIYCKGANWIPADAMPSRQTPEVYENLIKSAADANMNMLRIWGGGQYELDVFYELCDQYGILVWQDFMFACAEYPANDRKWLDLVRKEAEHQVKRLRDYACLALWCG
ncbi:MAG: glycoside hydrolase family 2 protein, partial [Lentisphaerae bacterium]|nr:glycoside hydrolase family 2 protein [Lentisphaerota bacterium]